MKGPAGCTVAWRGVLANYGATTKIVAASAFWISAGAGFDLNASSALHHIHRQPAARGFLVFGFHVGAGLHHGFDDLVE